MNSKLLLVRLQSSNELADLGFLPSYIECAELMLRKTNDQGQSVENFMRLSINIMNSPTGFVLIAVQNGALKGFLVANCIMDRKPWVEIIGLYISPTLNKGLRILSRNVIQTASDLFNKWAESLHAAHIYAGVIRVPEKLFKHFFAPLGYKKIGYIIEKEL